MFLKLQCQLPDENISPRHWRVDHSMFETEQWLFVSDAQLTADSIAIHLKGRLAMVVRMLLYVKIQEDNFLTKSVCLNVKFLHAVFLAAPFPYNYFRFLLAHRDLLFISRLKLDV